MAMSLMTGKHGEDKRVTAIIHLFTGLKDPELRGKRLQKRISGGPEFTAPAQATGRSAAR